MSEQNTSNPGTGKFASDAPPKESADAGTAKEGPPSILVIDDDGIFRKTLNFVLERRGRYRVLMAANGMQGYELAKTEKPDIIICDVMMREMHGYATVAAIRDLKDMQNVPVIMITGQGSPLGERRARVHGADYYLHKPLKLHKLMEMIRKALMKHKDNNGNVGVGWSTDLLMD